MNGYIEGDFAYADATKEKIIAYIGDDSDVIIPEGVETIGQGAFYVYRPLESVTVPASVSEMESQAFFDCCNLHVVNMLSRIAPDLGENVFARNAPDRNINIPCGSYSSYATVWNEPSLISSFHESMLDISIIVQSADPTQGTASGRLCDKARCSSKVRGKN